MISASLSGLALTKEFATTSKFPGYRDCALCDGSAAAFSGLTNPAWPGSLARALGAAGSARLWAVPAAPLAIRASADVFASGTRTSLSRVGFADPEPLAAGFEAPSSARRRTDLLGFMSADST